MSLFDAGLRLGYAYRQHHRGNTINYQAWKWRVKLIFTTVDRRSLSDRRGRELGTVWKFKIFLLHKFLHEINFGKWTFRKLQHVHRKEIFNFVQKCQSIQNCQSGEFEDSRFVKIDFTGNLSVRKFLEFLRYGRAAHAGNLFHYDLIMVTSTTTFHKRKLLLQPWSSF